MIRVRTQDQVNKIDELLEKPFSELTEIDFDIFIKDVLRKYRKHITYRHKAYSNRDPEKNKQYYLTQVEKRKNENNL